MSASEFNRNLIMKVKMADCVRTNIVSVAEDIQLFNKAKFKVETNKCEIFKHSRKIEMSPSGEHAIKPPADMSKLSKQNEA